MVDKFTGKPVDSACDRLPHYNGGRCDSCGGPTIDHCIICGAPQCCPACCVESQKEIQQQREQAAKSGLAHSHS